jgi:murein DD-endopeptidase MepM/ murein hydrolase activator NlpD
MSASPPSPGRRRSSARARRAFALLVLATFAAGMTACALPRWPVDGPLTSDYGVRFRGWKPGWHHGVDIAVPEGTPVRAMRGGSVAFAGVMAGYGNVVVLRHSRTLSTVYAHLSRIEVSRGDRVRGRQVIGLAGRTGDATGPHLHFEIVRGGRSTDPVTLLGGRPGRRK